MNRISPIGYLGIAGAGSLALCAGPAGAQTCAPNLVTLQEWHLAGCPSACSPQPCLQCNMAPNLALVIVESCSWRINIFAASTSIHAGPIDITNALLNHPVPYLEVFVGQGDFPYAGAQTPAVVGNVQHIRPIDPETRKRTRVAGHIGGTSAS